MTLMQDEAFVAFLEEAREHLVTLEEGLLRLEKERGNPSSETINAIFRAAHTIKGSSGFFALDKLKALAHAAENVLGLIRARAVRCTPAVISALLQASDLLRLMLDDVEHQDQVDAAAVIEQLALIEVEGPPDLDAAEALPAPDASADATPLPVEAPAAAPAVADAPAARAPSDPAIPSSAAFPFRSMPTQLLPVKKRASRHRTAFASTSRSSTG